jgi:hypothetical protein
LQCCTLLDSEEALTAALSHLTGQERLSVSRFRHPAPPLSPQPEVICYPTVPLKQLQQLTYLLLMASGWSSSKVPVRQAVSPSP